MFIVHVFVQVKPGMADAFIAATLENARSSILEPGVARFDVVRREDDADKLLLVEVYRTKNDAALHKETDHYLIWRDTVADMMAVPRSSVKYTNLFPAENGWDTINAV